MARKFKTAITVDELSSASAQAIAANVNGDTNDRVIIDAGGKITWGSGSATGDTTLYRSTDDTLKTDDTFTATSLAVTDQYTLPNTAGSANQVLGYDSSANIGFQNANVKTVTGYSVSTARPSNVDRVIWIGSTSPTGAQSQTNDIWLQTTS